MRIAVAKGAALLLLAFTASAATAASLKVFPVRVVLTPQEPVQTMTVENGGDAATRVQLRVFEWRQVDGKDVFAETRDVLVNPLLFEVPAEGKQIARFGLRTTAQGREKAYRVFLEEVPGNRPSKPGEVQTLLRISIPIFVPANKPADRAEGKLRWQVAPAGAGKLSISLRNEGDAHVQINRLTLSRDGREIARHDVSAYVLPGAAQRLVLDTPVAVAARERLRIDALTDHGDLSTEIVAEAAPRELSAR